MAMPSLFCLLHLLIILSNSPYSCSSSSPSNSLPKGSSISVDHQNDHLVSPNQVFTAGFYKVGINAYCFAIWFTEFYDNPTVVWMANRDVPVNGKHSKLSLYKDGNLVLKDADNSLVWSTQTKATNGSLILQLEDTGNLVLYQVNGHPYILWQSFDYPTDTLLPDQLFTRNSQLVSSRSTMNFSSGFFKLYFENNNVLSLLYNGPEITSVYWPPPYMKTWEAGRSTYNNSRIAKLDSTGMFNSSDEFGFFVSDFGTRRRRIMKVDFDGNIRVYGLVDGNKGKKWVVQWQAFSTACKIHGVCGPNSLCSYNQESGRRCTCVEGYKVKNPSDWSQGCEPMFKPCQQGEEQDYVVLPYIEYYGYDIKYLENITLEACKQVCLNDCNCKGFQYRFDKLYYNCYVKNLLYNGFQSGFENTMYIKLPKRLLSSQPFANGSGYTCPGHDLVMPVSRSYDVKHGNGYFAVLLSVGCVIGVLEIILIIFFFVTTRRDLTSTAQSYFPVAPGFKRFAYGELKKATNNFRKEIGRGGAGVVYIGELSDDRTAAIKMLKEASDEQGESEFQAEISTIGRLNHMNLIETWGYCVEGKHRLVVYEYMANGSLAKSLESNKLDWEKKVEIAIGTAKGLAYLHEECLEWVLHCDVKPHNILLDSDYNPKVADFGLSKLFDRTSGDNSSFSRIRGTRGYMAPEWVFNHPITSKVDVYSYGVVVLEMITGKSPLQMQLISVDGSARDQTLVEWVRQTIRACNESDNRIWIKEIGDGTTCGEYDTNVLANLVKIALQCVEEDRDARPSMSQVVNMLLHAEKDD